GHLLRRSSFGEQRRHLVLLQADDLLRLLNLFELVRLFEEGNVGTDDYGQYPARHQGEQVVTKYRHLKPSFIGYCRSSGYSPVSVHFAPTKGPCRFISVIPVWQSSAGFPEGPPARREPPGSSPRPSRAGTAPPREGRVRAGRPW